MPEQPKRHNEPVDREPEEARAGEIGRDGPVRGPMRYVLVISVVLAVAALAIAFVVLR